MKAERARAGVLRRGFSFFVDGILVFIPFQALAAILFVLTAGSVQFSHGITYTSCAKATGLPNDLKPAPPAHANAANVCKTYFFSAETARQLTISHVTKDGNTQPTVSQTYMVSRNDKVIDGWSLDWPAWIALFAYLFWARLREDGTIGDRANKIILVDDSLKTMSPPNVRQMTIRTLVLLGPMVAAMLGAAFLFYLDGHSADQLASTGDWIWLIALAAPVLIFYLMCSVQIALKRDPVWDRMARTAMLVKVAA